MDGGRQSGLVFGAVFKTVRRLLQSLVCSIRTVFRHCSPHPYNFGKQSATAQIQGDIAPLVQLTSS
jgi:hypothetical protein